MRKFPPFGEFEIVYKTAWAGSAVALVAAALLVGAYMVRRRRRDVSRLLCFFAVAMPVVWGAWEGIVATLGLDSVAGFFALMALATALGVAGGFWSRRARDGGEQPAGDQVVTEGR